MRHVAVAIVGAGFAGIGAAIQLERAGRGDFVVLEQAGSIGGTWRDNVYPGVACDIPSHLYSYSFLPNPTWSRRFAPGDEIRGYLEACVDAAGIRDRIRLDDGLRDATWTGEHWRLRTARGELTAESLVLACGRLTEPRLPGVPGLAEFDGPVVHSARWDPALDLRGRRVAVIGTGASAVQLAPELARESEVVLFQRTPAWVLPRGDHAYRAEEQAAFDADPVLVDAIRREAYLAGEALVPQRMGDLDALEWAQARALAHLHAQVPDPVLRAALMPDYELGCKRAVFSDDLYPAIASGAIVLEPSALVGARRGGAAGSGRGGRGEDCGGAIAHSSSEGARVAAGGEAAHSSAGGVLIAASGREHAVDAVVVATGFETAAQPYARLVRGAGGETLAEHWADGMVSVASTMVAGFPDLYVLDGPNASLGHNSAILMIEAQLDYVLDALRHRDATGRPLVPSAEAEADYTRRIDEAAAGTVWLTGGCRSWYVDRGRLTLLWPDTVDAFRERGARFDPADFRTSVGA